MSAASSASPSLTSINKLLPWARASTLTSKSATSKTWSWKQTSTSTSHFSLQLKPQRRGPRNWLALLSQDQIWVEGQSKSKFEVQLFKLKFEVENFQVKCSKLRMGGTKSWMKRITSNSKFLHRESSYRCCSTKSRKANSKLKFELKVEVWCGTLSSLLKVEVWADHGCAGQEQCAWIEVWSCALPRFLKCCQKKSA